jgi:hypothetical protein
MPFKARRFVCTGCGATEDLNCWQDSCAGCGSQLMPVKRFGADQADNDDEISVPAARSQRVFHPLSFEQVAA